MLNLLIALTDSHLDRIGRVAHCPYLDPEPIDRDLFDLGWFQTIDAESGDFWLTPAAEAEVFGDNGVIRPLYQPLAWRQPAAPSKPLFSFTGRTPRALTAA